MSSFLKTVDIFDKIFLAVDQQAVNNVLYVCKDFMPSIFYLRPLSSAGQSNALVTRRSSVRLRQWAQGYLTCKHFNI